MKYFKFYRFGFFLLRLFYILVIIIVYSSNLRSQNLAIFKSDNNKFGIRDTNLGQLIAEPKYNYIYQFDDSLFIVNNGAHNFGIIDSRGNYFDFKNTSISKFAIRCDSGLIDYRIKLRLTASPTYDTNDITNLRYQYFVNLKNECLPNDYFPCSPYCSIYDSINIPDYLKTIQKGERFVWQDDIDSAILFAKIAIEQAPNNPYPYYWGANLLIGHSEAFIVLFGNSSKVNTKNNLRFKHYFDWVCECLEKAELLEKRPYYALWIQKAKLSFYKNSIKNKSIVRITKDRIKELKKITKNCG